MILDRQTKNAAISALILAEKAEGLSIREAFDRVLGVGAWDRLASDLYDTLNAKSVAATQGGAA